MPETLPRDSVCIIPARGGSKRIPRKNIRPFAGRPMIAYSIRAAAESALFSRIIVSTDDEEIASIARAEGAETPFARPAELANDHAVTSAVIIHALRWLRAHGDRSMLACCIYPTAPFVQTRYLRAGYDALKNGDADCAVSVTTFPFPIWRARRIDENGRLHYIWPEYARTRSQDLPEAWHDAGQFYWYRIDPYIATDGHPPGGIVPVKLPRHLVQDIDTPEDWERAELMFQALRARVHADA